MREKIGDDEQTLAFVKVARVREAVDEAEVLPIQSKQLKALVGAICDGQNRRFPAVVHGDAVGTGELSGFLPGAAESTEKLNPSCVLVDLV